MNRFLAFALLVSIACPLPAADVAALMRQLKDSDSDARRSAAKSLGEAGAEARAAAPALAEAMRDKDRFVRRFAAEALGKIGADPKTAIPALVLALRDNAREVQQAAARALGSLGPNALPALRAALANAELDTAVRARAAESLGNIGPAAKSAIPDLISVLGEMPGRAAKKKGRAATGDIRLEVVNALGEIATDDDKSAIDALKNLATAKGNRDRVLRQAAMQAARKAQARKAS
jgi:HEAT repeat protein